MLSTVSSPARSSSSSKRPRTRAPRAPESASGNRKWAVIGVALVLALLGGYVLWSKKPAVQATVRVVDVKEQTITKGRLEFFEFDESGAAASPSKKLSEVSFTNSDPIRVNMDVEAVVRVTADGFGAGHSFLRLGASSETVMLGPAVSGVGTVIDSDAKPIAGARVLAFAGGAHGVQLGEAVSGADGKFTIGGVSSTDTGLLFRALKEGYAICEQNRLLESDELLVLKLLSTEFVTGRVVVPSGVSPKGLVVPAYQVLGVATRTDDEGRFILDHLPKNVTPRLIVPSLPQGYTHRATKVRAGQQNVEIIVTKACSAIGSIIDARTKELVAYATVAHDHGPRGRETFGLDPLGRWKLTNIPEGESVLEAYVNISSHSDQNNGRVTVNLKDGEVRENVVIEISR